MAPMRHFVSSLVIVLGLAGCQFDPVSACESRCEEKKSLGCESAGTDCENSCVLADDIYDDGYNRAEDAGCVSQYDTWVSCLDSTPSCATDAVIAQMCGEEYLILEDCW